MDRVPTRCMSSTLWCISVMETSRSTVPLKKGALEKFLVPVACHVLADNTAFQKVEQGGRTLTLVVVGHRPAAAALRRQSWVGAQRQDFRLFIDRQNGCRLGRIHIEADNIPQCGGKHRIARQLEGLYPMRLRAMHRPDPTRAAMADADGLHGRPASPPPQDHRPNCQDDADRVIGEDDEPFGQPDRNMQRAGAKERAYQHEFIGLVCPSATGLHGADTSGQNRRPPYKIGGRHTCLCEPRGDHGFAPFIPLVFELTVESSVEQMMAQSRIGWERGNDAGY
jgi:hypothetical protein